MLSHETEMVAGGLSHGSGFLSGASVGDGDGSRDGEGASLLKASADKAFARLCQWFLSTGTESSYDQMPF